jgi:Zn-dependent M32 family carboxypeptidase
VESKGDESPAADMRRMMVRMFNELKEDIQNNSMNPKRTWTQKKLKEDFNKLQNEKKEIIKKKKERDKKRKHRYDRGV